MRSLGRIALWLVFLFVLWMILDLYGLAFGIVTWIVVGGVRRARRRSDPTQTDAAVAPAAGPDPMPAVVAASSSEARPSDAPIAKKTKRRPKPWVRVLGLTPLLLVSAFLLSLAVEYRIPGIDSSIYEDLLGARTALSDEIKVTTDLVGDVVDDPIVYATVNFYSLKPDGSKGIRLGWTTTDRDGRYLVTLAPMPSVPFLAETRGGSYVDTATGQTIVLGPNEGLRAVIPVGATRATVSLLTHVAAALAQEQAAKGVPLQVAVDAANAGIAAQYALKDIIDVRPPPLGDAERVATSNRDERVYALVLAGIAQQAQTGGMRAIELANALAADAKDGIFDGLDHGSAIRVPLIAGGTIALSATSGTTDMQTAIDRYVASAKNTTHIPQVRIPLTPVTMGVQLAGLSNGSLPLYQSQTALPAALSQQEYTARVAATGGTPSYRCAWKPGTAHPDWLALVPSTCQITGTAPLVTFESITGPFFILLTDSSSPPRTIELAPLYVTVVGGLPEIIVPGSVAFEEGRGGSFTVRASGANPPFSYAFAFGSRPLGWTINFASGVVTVPPTSRAGSYSVRICAVDIGGRMDCKTVALTITARVQPTSEPTARPTAGPTGPGPTAQPRPTAPPQGGTWYVHWSCGSSSQCAMVFGAPRGIQTSFPSQSACQNLLATWARNNTMQPFSGSSGAWCSTSGNPGDAQP